MQLSWLFLAGVLFCTVLTIMQLLRYDHWLVRIADFPHVQLTGIHGFCLLGLLLSAPVGGPGLHLVALVTGAMVLSYQLVIIYPYTPFAPKRARTWSGGCDGPSLTILEANVLMDNQQHQPLIALIRSRKPDLVITLESNSRWEQALLAGLPEEYRYRICCPQDDTYGMHCFSRLPLQHTRIHHHIEENVPAIETDLLVADDRLVKLHVLHPKPPSPTENERSTERDAELVVVGKMVSSHQGPVIVAGDLNDVAWSHTTRLFQRLSRLLDPRLGRGFFSTYHADYPWFRWPLDHFFLSAHFSVRRMERLATIGSDHLPIVLEVCLEPEKATGEKPPPPPASKADHQEAVNKLRAVTTAEEAGTTTLPAGC